MNAITDPAAIIVALHKIDGQGWIADLQHDIRHAISHRDDIGRHPGHKLMVEHFAKLGYSLLGGSPGEWQQAACDALLPDTYRGTVLEIIDEYEQRADEAAAASRTSAKMARERVRS